MKVKLLTANGIVSVIDYMLSVCSAKLHHYVVQVMFSRLPKLKQAYYLINLIYGRATGNTKVPKLHISDKGIINDLKIEMLTPPFIQPDISDHLMVERIFVSFLKSKNDQKDKDVIFKPSTMWQKYLDSVYPNYSETDIDEFNFFLKNFGTGSLNTGINWGWLVSKYAKTLSSRKYFEMMIIGQKIDWWLKNESKGREISALSQPRHGNQWGANVNNNFIAYESVLNEFYSREISSLVRNDRPVILEIGAGYGILFYYTSKAFKNFCYLDFDLPEVLCCATYYLMKCFPDKKFLLYGEGKMDEEAIKENDFIFMPSYVIKEIPDNSIDICINMSSLSEMKAETCRMFLREICRTSYAFWYLNYENNRSEYEDGTKGLLNKDFLVDDAKFDLIKRSVNNFNTIGGQEEEPINNDYSYYYKRK